MGRSNVAAASVTDITPLAAPPTADDDLVADWLAGDDDAFCALVDRYGPPVHGFLRRLLGDPARAEDAWSETFLRIVRSREQYRPNGQFRAWVYTVARRCAIDEQRKVGRWSRLTSRFRQLSTTPARVGPESGLMARRRSERLDAALAHLSDAHHTIVLLAYRQGLTTTEVGEIVGLTSEQVQSRLAYARRLLKQHLDMEDRDV